VRDIACRVSPIRDHAFFEQPELERLFGHDLLQGAGLEAQVLHLVGGGGPRRVAGEPPLPSLKELLRPAVIHRRGNAFATAELGDALLAPKAFQHDADLLLGRELSPRRTADILHNLLSRLLLRPGFLSHLRSLTATMNQKSSLPEKPQSVPRALTSDSP
jgi:hypothetical protein